MLSVFLFFIIEAPESEFQFGSERHYIPITVKVKAIEIL